MVKTTPVSSAPAVLAPPPVSSQTPLCLPPMVQAIPVSSLSIQVRTVYIRRQNCPEASLGVPPLGHRTKTDGKEKQYVLTANQFLEDDKEIRRTENQRKIASSQHGRNNKWERIIAMWSCMDSPGRIVHGGAPNCKEEKSLWCFPKFPATKEKSVKNCAGWCRNLWGTVQEAWCRGQWTLSWWHFSRMP